MVEEHIDIQEIAKDEIGNIVESVNQVSTQDFAEVIHKINSELGVQRSEGKQMIQAVLVASVLILATVAVEVIYAHGTDVNRYDVLNDKFTQQAVKIAILEQKSTAS